MRTAVEPVSALAVDVREGVVVRVAGVKNGVEAWHRVRRAGGLHFFIGDRAIRADRQGQDRQRHRRLEQLAHAGIVGKGRRALFAQHLEGIHRRAAIRFRVGNEDERLRSRREIEIVAQSPGPAIEHQCVLFVRVIAGLRGAIFKVYLSRCFEAWQIARAIVAGEHDLLRSRWPAELILPHIGRPVGARELAARRTVLLKPPDFQQVFSSQCVDTDDRAFLRLAESRNEPSGHKVSICPSDRCDDSP